MIPSSTSRHDDSPIPVADRTVLASVLDALPAGVIALDSERRVRFANPAAFSALGYSPATSLSELHLGALLESTEVSATLRAVEADAQERRVGTQYQRSDGEIAEIGLAVVSAGAAGESEIRTILVLRALEETRALDQQMLRIERLTAVGKLAAGLAHEIRNPIATVQGLAEGLLEELDADDPRAEYASRILRQVDRIEGLVRSCLGLGDTTTRIVAYEPSGLIEEALEGMPEIAVTSTGPTPPVAADPEQVVDCLRALLANALEACHGRADQIQIRCGVPSEDSTVVEVQVVDRGPGIPGHLTTRIFEPFFTTKAGASGLGLATARLAAWRNNGSLDYAARADETVFTLRLPAAVSSEDTP